MRRSQRLSRRQAVLGTGLLGIAGILAACGGAPAPTAAPAAKPTEAAGVAAPTKPAVTTPMATTAAAAPAATTAAAVPATPAAAAKAPAVTSGGNLIEGTVGNEWDTLDTHVTGYQNSLALSAHFNDTLVRQDTSFKIYPGLAERWEMSPDATAFTFFLKKGVVFHDGTPFNAKAVQINFNRIADPATVSRAAVEFLGPYDKAEVIDDHTVKVVFKKPNPTFVETASLPYLGFFSPAALEKYGKEIGRNPIGTGYFKFKEWVAGKHVLFERNEQYAWASSAWKHTGPAYLATYKAIVLKDNATALAAFDKGEIQLTGLPHTDYSKYTGKPNIGIIEKRMTGFPNSVFMNVERAPTDDPRLRKALIYAVDPEAIIKISLGGLLRPAKGPLSSNHIAYDKNVEGLYKFDQAMSRKLLDEAGWTLGSDGIRQKDGKRLTLNHIVNAGKEPYTIPLQAMLKAVGVDMQIQVVSSAARVESNNKGEGHLALLGADNPDPKVLELVFHSRGIDRTFAWSRYRGKELDELLDSAPSEINQEARLKKYHRAQQIIMENALIVPLAENIYYTVTPKNLRDVGTDSFQQHWFYDTTFES